MGIIDGTIILIYKPDGENYILAEFYNSRKGYYGINCMIICDHRRELFFAIQDGQEQQTTREPLPEASSCQI